MQTEQDLYKGRNEYMHSSAAQYDAETKAAEESSKRISAAIKARMEAQKEADEYDEKARQNAQKRAEEHARRAEASAKKAGDAAKQSGEQARAGADGWTVFGEAVANLASRAAWTVIRKVTQGIREAVTEMKNVDTQLTNISKITGKTGKELSAIGDTAYDTASKYGIAASTYLESVYNKVYHSHICV